tara:strand:- start:4887 stop:5435 length:549 start_codon:yes stop_codon:yes gene_type:complete
MGVGDLGNAVLIIIIFSLIQLFVTLSIGISRIRNNWDDYKCNPGIIPFASVFGQDPIENFNQCIKVSQVGFMSGFLKPIYGALQQFSDSGNLFTQIFESLKLGLNNEQAGTFNLANDIGARIRGIITELNLVFITITDTFGKIGSTVTVLYYLIITSIKTTQTLWEELPGTIIRVIGSIAGG